MSMRIERRRAAHGLVASGSGERDRGHRSACQGHRPDVATQKTHLLSCSPCSNVLYNSAALHRTLHAMQTYSLSHYLDMILSVPNCVQAIRRTWLVWHAQAAPAIVATLAPSVGTVGTLSHAIINTCVMALSPLPRLALWLRDTGMIDRSLERNSRGADQAIGHS